MVQLHTFILLYGSILPCLAKEDSSATMHLMDDGDRIFTRSGNDKSSCSNHTNEYSYEEGPTGPDNWPAMYEGCAGEKQSPINVDMSDLENLKVKALQWSSAYFNTPKSMTLTNENNRAIVLQACYPSDCQPKLSGGPLAHPYTFHSVSFHFGTRDSKGSEHTIDEFSYPMEMQVLHTCNSRSSATTGDLVIVSYLFQLSDKDCSTIDKILAALPKALKRPNKPVPLKHPFNLASLVQPFSTEYVTYEGSLTSPPCTEGVKWILYPFPLSISSKQMNKFRMVCKYAPDMKNNYRPIQPVNDRKIYFAT